MVFFSNLTRKNVLFKIWLKDSLYSFKTHTKDDPLRKITCLQIIFVSGCVPKQTECVKMSSVLFTIRSQYPVKKTDKYGSHTTDGLTILCVVRISYNTPNPSAIKLTGNKCLSWLPIPIIACISETRPFRLSVNWFPRTCLQFGCFLCTVFAEALIHDFQRKWNLPVSIRWHGLTLYLLKPNLQLSSLFVLLGRDDNGEFVCSR